MFWNRGPAGVQLVGTEHHEGQGSFAGVSSLARILRCVDCDRGDVQRRSGMYVEAHRVRGLGVMWRCTWQQIASECVRNEHRFSSPAGHENTECGLSTCVREGGAYVERAVACRL